MAVGEHITEFAGKPVLNWEPGMPIDHPQDTNYRIAVDWAEADKDKAAWATKFAAFLADPDSRAVTGLVVGPWGEVYESGRNSIVVDALLAAHEQLPNLAALFLGDITYEEAEISWINQSDMAPLLEAYPRLEHLAVRGGSNLNFGPLRHDHLKTLIVQTGGLDRGVVHQVFRAYLPNLEHIELWLGDENYGGNTTVADLVPLLSGTLYPKLRYLGLCDTELADEIAVALQAAPVMARLKVLDLSLGTLGDTGAAALLANPAVARLEKLDIHHHFCSEEMVAKLRALPLELDASDPQDPDEDVEERFVAVSE
jgi:hypothetical protein